MCSRNTPNLINDVVAWLVQLGATVTTRSEAVLGCL
jgi:hypothetical protein